ncbi:SIMPL domain-containing protein [Cobetia amphilecti]|uniref:SIMPL domain-containing protein n=1 Tax=Cobetia amphilecti TaxID=1055104 RepID=A0ABT6URC9_9GAMM|nr:MULTISPECIES: SIMPL domain-containing protein [Cobetia]MCK8067165.1 SIMPL domain-containing protein [Cobetia sp. 1CM21F]MDI5884910.1 SIMPL domain-containing protein [Cobetia amphilecti]TCJ26240.1 SIMPL domain-containing protein [Halomonas sp. GDM18]
MRNIISSAVLGGLLAVGMVWSGSYLKQAAQVWESSSRVVTVKGLAEREVKADLALWPLHFSVNANQLTGLHEALANDERKIRAFLTARGFPADQVSVTSPQVTDLYANSYNAQRPDERYRAEATVLVRSPKVDLVKQSASLTGELVREGILLSADYAYRTEFLFTGLEAIKPDMIAAATADARRAAQQFAEDSGSTVGHIKHASQGYFSISDLDSYTPDIKNVRVVTTIDYTLSH